MPLAGGFTMGKSVYFIGGSQIVSKGNRLVYGHQGVVMGVGDNISEVAVQIAGSEGTASFLPTLVRSPRAAVTSLS
jgi:hypothetical protein